MLNYECNFRLWPSMLSMCTTYWCLESPIPMSKCNLTFVKRTKILGTEWGALLETWHATICFYKWLLHIHFHDLWNFDFTIMTKATVSVVLYWINLTLEHINRFKKYTTSYFINDIHDYSLQCEYLFCRLKSVKTSSQLFILSSGLSHLNTSAGGGKNF